MLQVVARFVHVQADGVDLVPRALAEAIAGRRTDVHLLARQAEGALTDHPSIARPLGQANDLITWVGLAYDPARSGLVSSPSDDNVCVRFNLKQWHDYS